METVCDRRIRQASCWLCSPWDWCHWSNDDCLSHLHFAKRHRPFELLVNENYELKNDLKLKQHFREVRLKIPWRSPLSAEINDASTWRIGVPVVHLLSTWEWLFYNDCSCCAIQNKTCSNRMQWPKRYIRYVMLTSVLWRWFVNLLSNLLHYLWIVGLAAASPVR